MANSTSIQTIVDGPRNVVVKFEGILDTSNLSSTTIIDPALLSDMVDNTKQKASQLRIDKISYDVEAGLEVNLFWDATTPVRILPLVGFEEMKTKRFGGLQNNAGAGKTGKITATTTSNTAVSGTNILSFSVVLECTKQL